MSYDDSEPRCEACDAEERGWCGSCEICDRYDYDHTCEAKR